MESERVVVLEEELDGAREGVVDEEVFELDGLGEGALPDPVEGQVQQFPDCGLRLVSNGFADGGVVCCPAEEPAAAAKGGVKVLV